MTPTLSLTTLAQRFAADLKDLLNATVCDGAYVGVLERPDGDVVVGTELRKLARAQPVRLRGRGDLPLWLTMHMRMSVDRAGYLVTQQSTYTISKGFDRVELLHYDYERSKFGYPDAHVQIVAGSGDWDDVLLSAGRSRGGLGKLHLTVGGRRYRPSIEDVIEMLIAERLLEPKPHAHERLNAGRDDFHRRQLRAAIRRDPDAAVLELREAGYVVTEPDRVARLTPGSKPGKRRGR